MYICVWQLYVTNIYKSIYIITHYYVKNSHFKLIAIIQTYTNNYILYFYALWFFLYNSVKSNENFFDFIIIMILDISVFPAVSQTVRQRLAAWRCGGLRKPKLSVNHWTFRRKTIFKLSLNPPYCQTAVVWSHFFGSR